MKIALETSKGNPIDNVQGIEISAFERNWNQKIQREFGQKVRFKSSLTSIYNCHGMTFACRRCRITEFEDIDLILTDDQYREVSEREAEPGDVVIYYDENGEPNHSGIVLEGLSGERYVPLVLSKWGSAGEAIHNAPVGPYGIVIRYYRCDL